MKRRQLRKRACYCCFVICLLVVAFKHGQKAGTAVRNHLMPLPGCASYYPTAFCLSVSTYKLPAYATRVETNTIVARGAENRALKHCGTFTRTHMVVAQGFPANAPLAVSCFEHSTLLRRLFELYRVRELVTLQVPVIPLLVGRGQRRQQGCNLPGTACQGKAPEVKQRSIFFCCK